MIKSLKDIDINYLKKHNRMIHFFGLGFIQIKISDEQRIHFYTDKLKSITDSPHNHRYDFRSKTLKGSITHFFYKEVPGNSWVISKENCQKDQPSIAQKTRVCDLKLLNKKIIKNGEEIFLNHKELHSVYSNNCITLINRSYYKKEFADVATKIGEPKICPFSIKVEEELLWDIVEEMLRK